MALVLGTRFMAETATNSNPSVISHDPELFYLYNTYPSGGRIAVTMYGVFAPV